jgi:hypothetical protein
MSEADFYEPVKECLERSFTNVGRAVYLEVAARKGFSETAKRAIPDGREIVFAFLRRKPDILGFTEGQYTKSLITAEVKEGSLTLDDIYQAKLYKEVFDAAYGFLITVAPIQEEIKRLCKRTFNILHSAGDYRQFLAIAQFDSAGRQLLDWVEEDPFQKAHYWNS